MKNTAIIVVAAVVGWLLWAKTKAIDKLQFYVSGIDASLVNGSPVIGLTIAIQNPTNEQFFINSVVGRLTANGQSIGNVSSFAQVPVPPVSVAYYPVQIRINLVGAALTIYNLITGRIGTSQTVGFEGSINASGIVAPIDLTATIA